MTLRYRHRKQTQASERRLLEEYREVITALQHLQRQHALLLEEHRALLEEQRSLLALLVLRQT
jgi:hypothetical protein